MGILIWLIGALFTVGLAVDLREKDAWWQIPFTFIAWPFVLGMGVADYLDDDPD